MIWKIGRTFAELGLAVLLPSFCCQCHRPGTLLCESCAWMVELRTEPIMLSEKSQLTTCFAPFAFTPPISTAITSLKYQGARDLAETLAELLFLHAPQRKSEAIAYVPLHPQKKRMRGYNQAEVIARRVATLAAHPLFHGLERTTYQHSQASRHYKEERVEGLHTSPFRVRPEVRAPTSLTLIDDVYTTGTTLEQCAAALRAPGTLEIHGLTLAHGS